MPTPDLQGVELPNYTDTPAVPDHLLVVFRALMKRALPRYASEAQRDTENPAPTPGQLCVLVAAGVPTVQIFKSGAPPAGGWVTLWSDPAGSDTGWVAVETNSGFQARPSALPQVRRIGNRVYFRGGWDNVGMSANGTFGVGTVPEGFRPSPGYAHYGLLVSSTNAASGARLAITPSGVVTVGTLATLGGYYLGAQNWTVD